MLTVTQAVCLVEGCGGIVRGRGYCSMHYNRVRRYGDPGGVAPQIVRKSLYDPLATCAVEGCERLNRQAGYCGMHYQRLLRHGAVGPTGERRKPPSPDHVCSIEGCDRPYVAREWCALHYNRWVKYGEPGEAGRRRAENGKGKSHGYKNLTINGRKIPEHRWVVEQHLGRPLHSDETVHHRNGDKKDNRIENLELWSSRHPKGARVKDQLDWAWSIIERYGMIADDIVAS